MNNKQKNRALVIGFIIMLLVAYRFSFSKTIEIKTRVAKLEKDKAVLNNAEAKIKALKLEERYLDSILQSNDLSIENTFQQTLLIKVTALTKKHHLKLISENKPHIYRAANTNLQTYEIKVQGTFRNLMLFSNALEQQRLAKLSSLTFRKKRNYRNGKNYLESTLVLQRFSK
ncbi:MAG: hypothetical protein JXQ93_03370 [Flavobacteriaceae bacterium]